MIHFFLLGKNHTLKKETKTYTPTYQNLELKNIAECKKLNYSYQDYNMLPYFFKKKSYYVIVFICLRGKWNDVIFSNQSLLILITRCIRLVLAYLQYFCPCIIWIVL